MDFENNFLSEQIITYLGNKRKLIKFIDKTVNKIILEDDTLNIKENENISFFDIFSGSGIVARYAKLKGFKVSANDLEIYSKNINEAMLNTNPSELQSLFGDVIYSINNHLKVKIKIGDDNYQEVLNFLNKLEKPRYKSSLYFSKNYAPKDTNNPNFEKERLFYTQENALIIDSISEVIFDNRLFSEKSRNIILCSLMYTMTKHINTSGTMKGFHNGWGGPTKTSLKRIMSKIVLEKLPFIEGKKSHIYQSYAESIFNEYSLDKIDIIYADPPYNQHQYSANYNHLVTVCKNDKYDPGIVDKGSRAGIRTDHNRSNFCKSIKFNKEIKLAEKSFIDFINSINCKYLIMSYNNEGLIKMTKLVDILSQNGKNKVSVETQNYSKFKGGKNTNQDNHVIEYLLVVKMDEFQNNKDIEIIKTNILNLEVKHFFMNSFIDYNKIDTTIFDISYINNYVFVTDKDFVEVMKIDKNTFKVIKENADKLSDSNINYFKNIELDNENLMEKYIASKNLILAKKLLSSFNIKKLKETKESFMNKIKNMETEMNI